MCKQWLRIILLALAIITLDNLNLINSLSNMAYADEASPIVGGKANHPSCDSAGLMVAIIGGVVAALVTIKVGFALLPFTEPITVATGLSMIASATIALAALVTGAVQFFACTHSFVRHPVLRWESDGRYRECKNPELLFPGDASSGYVCKSQEYKNAAGYDWPKNKAPYGDYIEVCYRAPMGGLFTAHKTWNDREDDFGYQGDFKDGQTEDEITRMKEAIGGLLSCGTIKSGEKVVLHTITFKAYEDGGRICVDAVGSFGGEFWPFAPTVGCHARAPSPPAPMCEQSVPTKIVDGKVVEYDNSKCFSCYISGACYSKISLAARAPFPMTSVIIQCIKESLDNLLTGTCTAASGATSKTGLLITVQERLKDAVQAVLVLAIALFGIKMMMGHAIQGPHEYFMLLIKLALVIYFSFGDGMSVYYRELVKLSIGLSDLVLSAGGSDQICNYESGDYIKNIAGVTKDYSYLAPWDRLDCRMGFYLGSGIPVGAGAASAAAIVAAATVPIFGILLLIIPSLFFGNILIAICVAFFVFMLILTVIWIIHLFILSLIALTIISLFAPLFIPMVLFQATKGFFDGWLRQLMAFSIYPIILFAFLALVFSVFDKLYFEDLTFKSYPTKKVVDKSSGAEREIEAFVLDPTTQCNNSNIIACIVSNIKFSNRPLLLGISVTSADVSGDTTHIWKSFGMMGLMGFLFYHFLGVIGGMAAELSGSFRADLSQGSMNPKQMAAKAEAGAMKVAGAIGGVAKAAANKAKGGDDSSKKGGGDEEVSRSVPQGGD